MKRNFYKVFLVFMALAGLAAAQQKSPGLTIEAADGKQTVLSLEHLKQMPRQTVTVVDAKSGASQKYEGVLLSTLLAEAGAPAGSKLHGPEVRDYVIVTGSDGYKALFSLFELDPASRQNQVLLADTMNGQPLEGNNGPLKLVVPEDKRHERGVRMVTSIAVRQAP